MPGSDPLSALPPEERDRLHAEKVIAERVAAARPLTATAYAAAALDAWRHEMALHPPAHAGIGNLMDDVRAAYTELGAVVIEAIPPGRHRQIALTALKESSMWAICAIACDPLNEPTAITGVATPDGPSFEDGV